MLSNIDLANQISEDILLGNIESYIVEQMNSSKNMTMDVKNMGIQVIELNKAITSFRAAKEEKAREDLAISILIHTTHFRLNGILKNNPNSTKFLTQERDFLREQVKILEKVIERQEDTIKNYARTIMEKSAGSAGVR